MPCQPLRHSILCTGGQVYDFGGYLFEIHRYLGPCPLHRKTLDPRKLAKAFWKVWDSFEKLSDEQQAAFAVET